MNRADRITGVIIFLLSVYIVIGALKMHYWHDTAPGPGFMPLWTGLAMGLTSLYIVVKTFIKPGSTTSPFKKEELRAMAVVVFGTIGAVLLSMVTGLMIAICIMIGFMTRFLGTKRWKTIVLVSIISTILLYLTFTVALSVPMPDSLIGL